MINIFTRNDLQALLDEPEGRAVSIYMPMRQGWPDLQQNLIRLKTLLRTAEEQLTELGLDPAATDAYLDSAYRLLDDDGFWRQQSHGLAIFTAPGRFHVFRLPLAITEQVVIDRRWHVSPLLPLLAGDGQFFVLALSLNQVRLVWATRDCAREIDIPDIPHSLAETLQYDEFEKQHQLHAGIGAHGSTGARSAIFHGQGDHTDTEPEEIQRFLHQVAHGVDTLLRSAQAPLVLAGVGHLLPTYAAVNAYPYLVEQGVTGNPDDLSADDLREQAWVLVEPLFQRARQTAADRYHALLGTGLTSCDLREILTAVYGGRNDTLFLRAGDAQWGSFDPATATIELHTEQEPDDEELLEVAAAQTLAHDGRIYVLEAAEMPADVPLAAIFRY